jgi:hypothetical protein
LMLEMARLLSSTKTMAFDPSHWDDQVAFFQILQQRMVRKVEVQLLCDVRGSSKHWPAHQNDASFV